MSEQTFKEFMDSVLCWKCEHYEEVEEENYEFPYFCNAVGDFMNMIKQRCSLFEAVHSLSTTASNPKRLGEEAV